MVKVFFNNSCNICRAEINHYKKHSDGNLEWVDVTDNQDAQQLTSKSYKDLLRRMHVIQDGKVINVEGINFGDWVLIDGGDIIVHLFRPEVRAFYGLEKMWGVEFETNK